MSTAVEEIRRTPVGPVTLHSRHWASARPAADGASVPVVLVHGFGIASRMCRPVARQLAARHDVHAPDLPGFGDSEHPDGVPDVAGLADALAGWTRARDLPPAIVVGVSFGSQVAAELAHRHPTAVDRVVLASPTVDAAHRSWPAVLRRLVQEQATQSMAMRLIQLRDHPKAGARRLLRTWQHAMAHRIEDAVAGIQRPVLVCWASRDPLLRRRWAAQLADTAPDGRLAVLPGAVHATTHDNPLELARAVEHFASPTPW